MNRYGTDKLIDKIIRKIVWRLPKRFVMWCGYCIGAHATQGEYGTTIVPELTFMDAMKRYTKRQDKIQIR